MVLKDHLLTLVILPLMVLFIASSYYRFMVMQDYTIGYEGDCNPYTQNCYYYCDEWDDADPDNDDECAEPFYYSWIDRHAGMIYNTCAPEWEAQCEAAALCIDGEECEAECNFGSVALCDAAYECGNGDESCFISFCDPESEDCEELTEADIPTEASEDSFAPEEIVDNEGGLSDVLETDDDLNSLMENTI